VPDATSRVGYITVVPRNKVDVQVHDRLARCRPDVESDVPAIWLVFALDERACLLYGSKERLPLLGRRLEPARHVAPGYEERMTGRNGVSIPKRYDEGVF
jgi:hypothetical protein